MLWCALSMLLLISVGSAALPAQSAPVSPSPPARVAILGVGGQAPGEASRVAEALDSLVRSRLPAGLELARTDSLAQYIGDHTHVDWRQLFALSDLVSLARVRRLEAVLEVRVHTRADTTTLEIQLADIEARDWIGVPVVLRASSASEALAGARAPADSLLRTWRQTVADRAR